VDQMTHETPQTSSGRTCRAQHVNNAREPRPPRRTLRCHVSRQVLVEPGPHHSRSLLVNGRPTLAWVHSALVPRLEIYSGHPWNGRLCLWRAGLHPRGAWGELAERKPGVMTLISLAIVVAFGTSLAATFG
jgi:cation transport ATPase